MSRPPSPGSTPTEAAGASSRLRVALGTLPLVAILRGLQPHEAVAIGHALYENGFRLIEVPLNSPEPFDSIARLRAVLPADAVLGAGTVLDAADVPRLRDAGGELVVMPHADTAVIGAAKRAGLACLPGAATPTEAFAALRAGADGLKLFPADLVTPPVLRAMRAVLPAGVPLIPVGGITPERMDAWRRAGATGFGLGSALYAPGHCATEVGACARAFVEAWRGG
jgi:2-dehydro-3-deoxyphosphogalactonate aldolase